MFVALEIAYAFIAGNKIYISIVKVSIEYKCIWHLHRQVACEKPFHADINVVTSYTRKQLTRDQIAGCNRKYCAFHLLR